MARWSFLRHGESLGNAENWLAGHTDADLTARGESQAREVGSALADVPFERILVSDLTRATRTLSLALPSWTGPVTVTAGLRERTIGDWDGMYRDALVAQGAFDVLLTWAGRPPNGESHEDLAIRAIRELHAHDADTDTLVVCHGGLMRAVLGALDGRAHTAIPRIRYPNCALQTRQVALGEWGRRLAALEAVRAGA